MRRWMAYTVAALCLLFCAGCGTQLADAPLPLDELPNNYSLAQAKKDGCAVFEDGRMVSGQGMWDSFVEASSHGKAAEVRLCRYESRENGIYFHDLSYDGEAYTVRAYENGRDLVETYPYMMYYAGRAEAANAQYSSYVRYVMTKDNSVTWEEIEAGRMSSQPEKDIAHHVVYEEFR